MAVLGKIISQVGHVSSCREWSGGNFNVIAPKIMLPGYYQLTYPWQCVAIRSAHFARLQWFQNSCFETSNIAVASAHFGSRILMETVAGRRETRGTVAGRRETRGTVAGKAGSEEGEGNGSREAESEGNSGGEGGE